MAKETSFITTVSISSAIQNANRNLPVVYSQDVQGGFTTTENRTSLRAIPPQKLQDGMIVYQQATETVTTPMAATFNAGYYRFNQGALVRNMASGEFNRAIIDSDWEEIQLDVDSISVGTSDPVPNANQAVDPPTHPANPTNPHDGDLYLNNSSGDNTLWYYSGMLWIQVNSATATTVASLDNIGDVDTSGKVDGDLLQWDGTNSEWVDTDFTLDQYIGNPINTESDVIGQLDYLPAVDLSSAPTVRDTGTLLIPYSVGLGDSDIILTAGERVLPIEFFRMIYRAAYPVVGTALTFTVGNKYVFSSTPDTTFVPRNGSGASRFITVEDVLFTWNAALNTQLTAPNVTEESFLSEVFNLIGARSSAVLMDGFILADRTIPVSQAPLWVVETETTRTANANDIEVRNANVTTAGLYLNPNQANREFDIEINEVLDAIMTQLGQMSTDQVIRPFLLLQTFDTTNNVEVNYRFPVTNIRNITIGNPLINSTGIARRFDLQTDMLYDNNGNLIPAVFRDADVSSGTPVILTGVIDVAIGYFGGLTDLLNNNIIRDYNLVRNEANRITGIREFNLGLNNPPLQFESYSRAEVDDRVERALERVHSNGTTHFVEENLPIPSTATNLNVLQPSLPSAQQTTFRIDPDDLSEVDRDIIVSTSRSINTQPFVAFDINRYETDFGYGAENTDWNESVYELLDNEGNVTTSGVFTFTGRIVNLDENIDANNIRSIQVAVVRSTLATGTSTTPEADLILLEGGEFYFNLNNQGLTAEALRTGTTPSAVGPFIINSIETSTADPTLLFINLNGELDQISQADRNTIININSGITTALEKSFTNFLTPDLAETIDISSTATASRVERTIPGGTAVFTFALMNSIVTIENRTDSAIVIRARYEDQSGAIVTHPGGDNGVFEIASNTSQSISYDPGVVSGLPTGIQNAIIDLFHDDFERENQFTVGTPVDFHRVSLITPLAGQPGNFLLTTSGLPGSVADAADLRGITTGFFVYEFTGTGGEVFQGIYTAAGFNVLPRFNGNNATFVTAAGGQWFPRVPVQSDVRARLTARDSTRVRIYRIDEEEPTQSVFYYINESTLGTDPANPLENIINGTLLIDGTTPYNVDNTLVEEAVPTQAVYPLNNTIDIGYFSGVIQSQNLEIIRVVRDPISGTTVFNHDNTYTDSAGTVVDADRFFRGFYRSDTLALVYALRQVHVMMDGTTETTWADWDGQINRFQTLGALADFLITPQTPITLNDYAYLYQMDGTNDVGLYRRNVTNTQWVPVVFNRSLPTA